MQDIRLPDGGREKCDAGCAMSGIRDAERYVKTVLIVDPDYAISGIGSVISMQGFMTIVMPEARAALDLLRSGMPVDLVITELLLQDMDGMEFLQAVKTSAPTLPVLVVTAEYSIESYLRAMSLDVFDYLHKPARDADLCRSARHAVNLANQSSLPFTFRAAEGS